jgi:threonine dehydratase
MLINNNTPVDIFWIKGRTIYVKREDLSTNPPCPSLAKLRGVYKRILKLKEQGVKTIAVMDTRISKSGIGCAAIANEIGGIEVINFYPHLKAQIGTPENQQRVLDLGHKIYPLLGGRTAVLFSQMTRMAHAKGWHTMPLGLVVEESVDGVIKECESLNYKPDIIVIAVGSGMMLAGVSIALAGKVKKIIGISAGMSPVRQRGRIMKLLGIDLPSNVEIIKSDKGYYEPEECYCPFPCSIWYDRKAWKWLVDNIDSLEGKVLFWNIGN